MMYKNYGGIEKFYNVDYEFFVDCLEYAVMKEQEIPRLINLVLNKVKGNDISVYNKKMRTAEEILKDYGLGGGING